MPGVVARWVAEREHDNRERFDGYSADIREANYRTLDEAFWQGRDDAFDNKPYAYGSNVTVSPEIRQAYDEGWKERHRLEAQAAVSYNYAVHSVAASDSSPDRYEKAKVYVDNQFNAEWASQGYTAEFPGINPLYRLETQAAVYDEISRHYATYSQTPGEEVEHPHLRMRIS